MEKKAIKRLMNKTKNTLKEEGVKALAIKSTKYLTFKISAINRKYDRGFKDILFINGCSLPHPQRYRVTHQIEQLESYGVSCDKIDYEKLDLDMIRFYRGFIFYRCPILPIIEEFIKVAKENNKTIFYDIDDLVFDLKDTNKIKFLDTMTKEERELYDNGVIRMGKTLDLCEYGIASTERLQIEMSKHLKEVHINRNVASEIMVSYSIEALKKVQKDKSKVIIGYLSGTITHNDDFKLIMPVIIEVLKKYKNAYLKIVGLLDLPKEMEEVKDKILTSPFVNWTDLPNLIRSVDINLAPLEDTVFNEAKSENKWTEAALVKIPTVASDVGAFKSQIINNETGFLCKNNKELKEALEKLIENQEYREKIGQAAYDEVIENHVTTNSGKKVADFIKSKLRRNFLFVMPSVNVSGGIMVAIKHGIMLKKKGYDVTIMNINKETSFIKNVYEKDEYLNVVPKKRVEFLAYVDTVVATMWLTLDVARKYLNCSHIKYLVQGKETDFYKPGTYEKIKASATYNNILNVEYLTVSKWCQAWLKKYYDVEAKYIPNGIDLDLYPIRKRNFKDKKIKILIEGNSKDYYKNVDESFKIVEQLDKDKYEINYLSYEKEPKKWYYVDNFYHKVPHDKVGEVYKDTDILLKTSLLESFSYPPLEIMATGGLAVVLPNGGNSEYLKDKENCLLYEPGNIKSAVEKIENITKDKELREKLIENGLKTAQSRSWDKIEEQIINVYE